MAPRIMLLAVVKTLVFKKGYSDIRLHESHDTQKRAGALAHRVDNDLGVFVSLCLKYAQILTLPRIMLRTTLKPHLHPARPIVVLLAFRLACHCSGIA